VAAAFMKGPHFSALNFSKGDEVEDVHESKIDFAIPPCEA
jgi:hypothetical protein